MINHCRVGLKLKKKKKRCKLVSGSRPVGHFAGYGGEMADPGRGCHDQINPEED